jgi:hypothetical protein
MKYKIQLLFAHGWDDEVPDPFLYNSKEEAENWLKEDIADQYGPMEERMTLDDYRIIEAN